MGNFLILYDNAADAGLLSGGAWVPTLGLPSMQDPRPTKRARSVGLDLTATQFKIALPTISTFKALAFGPTNFTSSAQYRITSYDDDTYSSPVYDSDWMDIGVQAVPSLDLAWEDPNFWTGVQPVFDPDGAGIFVVHPFDGAGTGKFWLFEIDDQGNGDGFIEIGRLFMGRDWQASINYSPDGNSFGYKPYTTTRRSIGGTLYGVRRKTARTLQVAFPYLPTQEVFNNVHRMNLVSGLDKQVFVIPDPDDIVNRNIRSFLGNLEELQGMQLMSVQLGAGLASSTAIRITEAL